jgi:hypothetical protein
MGAGQIRSDLALAAVIRIGRIDGSALHATSRPAGKLARRRGRALDQPSDLLEGQLEHVVLHEGSRSAGASVSSHATVER